MRATPPTSRPTSPRTSRTRFARGMVSVALVAAALGGCAGGGAATAGTAVVAPPAADGLELQAKSAAAGAAPGVAGAAPGVAGAAAADAGAQSRAASPNDTSVADPKIVRTAAVALTVDAIGPATAKIRAAVAGFGGHLVSEAVNTTDAAPQVAPQTQTGSVIVPRQGNYGQLTFAVPADKLDAAIDAVGQHGTVVQRTASSQDVTATYVDTEARIATMTASIQRIRALMTQTQNITQIVELEAQLANREAQLESMQAQLRALQDRVAMSQLTVIVSTSVGAAVLPTEDAGFLAGLKQGWTTFLKSVTTLLTVVGALLPWLIVAALAGWPLWRRWRARRDAGTSRSIPPRPAESLHSHPPVVTPREIEPARPGPAAADPVPESTSS